MADTTLSISPSASSPTTTSRRGVPLRASKVRFKFLILQSLMTIVLSYQVLFGGNEFSVSEIQEWTVLALLLLTGSLMLLPAQLIVAPWFPAALVSFDTVLATVVIYLSGHASPDLYLAYFLIILIAASVPRLTHVLALSAILCVGYGIVIYSNVIQGGTFAPGHLLGIPVLLIMAAFYGTTAEAVHKERQMKVDLIKRIDELQREETALREGHEQLRQQVHTLSEERARVTESLRKERLELTRVYEQLQDSPRMEVVGRFARGVAPDMDELVTKAGEAAGAILSEFPPEAKAHRSFDELLRTGERVACLARQLQTVGRTRTPKAKVLAANSLLSQMEGVLSALVGSTIQVRLLLHPKLDPIKVDPDHLEEIMLALALRAKSAMARGGTLTVETSHVEFDESFVQSHFGATRGHYVMLAVRDTGRSIDAEAQTRIFEPFATGDVPGAAAVGLRLGMIYGLVKLHGGYIEVSSRPGRGTAFQLYFPRVSEPVGPPEGSSLRKGMGDETILLIEPDADGRAIASESLKSCGYTLLEAGTAHESMAIAEKYTGTIHLIIVELGLARPQAESALPRLLRARQGSKVVVSSGYPADLAKAMGVPAVAYVQKPYAPSAVARTVRAALDTR